MRSKLLAGGVILLFASMSSVSAYETDWNNKKLKGEDPNSEVKIGGQLFLGYDFVDKQTDGTLDVPSLRGSSTGKGTGFDIQRVYLYVKGKVKSGPAKGWDYNVTLDGGYHADEWNDQAAGNPPKNDIMVFVKNAWVTAPVKFIPVGKNHIRVGMQDTPISQSMGGVKSTSMWGHRYLADAGKPHYAEVGLDPAVDQGVSFAHKTDMYGVHLMLHNGDGYHAANAQGLTTIKGSTSLSSLAQQSLTNNSYALDLTGNINIIPTGKDKKNHFSVSLPFKIKNYYGIEKKEYERVNYDITGNTFAWSYQRGSEKAFKDSMYGYELVYQNKSDALEFTVGYGNTKVYDKGGDAVQLTNALVGAVPTGSAAKAENAAAALYGCGATALSCKGYNNEGDLTYWYAHAKFAKKFGAFIRVFDGSTQGSGKNVKAPENGKAQWIKIATADNNWSDGISGSAYINSLNTKGRFNTTEYGLEYFANAMFRIAIGTYYNTYTAGNGETKKTSQWAGTYATNGTTSVETQARTLTSANPGIYSFWASTAGYVDQTKSPTADDFNRFFGKEQKDQQTWIRMLVVY
jgi:hypothetical protein